MTYFIIFAPNFNVMNLIELETILRDQKAELDLLREDKLISRPEEDLIDLRSRLAQVVIGVRRSGNPHCVSMRLRKPRSAMLMSILMMRGLPTVVQNTLI